MPSRDIRRAKQRKGESVSETIEKRHETHPFIYGFSIVILVVIVVTFVLAGPGGPLSSAGRSGTNYIVFGSYNGRDIAYSPGNYFARQRDYIYNQMSSSGNTSSLDSLSMTQQIWYQAFLNTAEHVAVLDQVDRAGATVSRDALDKALIKYPAYLDENNQFSELRYNAITATEKASILALTRENLISDIYVNDVLGGPKTGTKETEFIKGMVRPERSFSFVTWLFASFPAGEVRKYGEANSSRFSQIKVSRILVKASESQAKEIRKKIVEKTSTFEDLAKAYSKDSYADKGGDMGWRYAYDLEADFELKEAATTVLALQAGELSDVLKGSFGWLIYRCDSETVEPDFGSATVQADVKNYITTYEKGKIEDYFNERAGQLSRRAGEVGFDAAVKEMGLKAGTTDPFPVNLSNVFSFAPLKATVDADTPTNAQYSEDFFFRAFSLGKDQVSAPIVLDDQVIVLKLKGEQQLPESTVSILDSWINYVASQSVQIDLAQALMTPERLRDNFTATFNQYLAPTTSSQ